MISRALCSQCAGTADLNFPHRVVDRRQRGSRRVTTAPASANSGMAEKAEKNATNMAISCGQVLLNAPV
jgi:hypothetical protein